MPKLVVQQVIEGCTLLFADALTYFNKAVSQYGKEKNLAFPASSFYLPLIYGLSGKKIATLKDAGSFLEEVRSSVLSFSSFGYGDDSFEKALEAGSVSLFLGELILAIKYLFAEEPQLPDCEGFICDEKVRALGIQLVDGRLSGIALLSGASEDRKVSMQLLRQLQAKNILVFVGAGNKNASFVDYLQEEKLNGEWDSHLIVYGKDALSMVYPLNWIMRVVLTFGGIKPANRQEISRYIRQHLPAVGIILGGIDPIKCALSIGACALGLPFVVDTKIPSLSGGKPSRQVLIEESDYEKIVERALELGGIKTKVTKIDIPVPYSSAFEGERIREEDMYVEFGGEAGQTCQYLRMRPLSEISDGKIEVIGPDIDTLEEGKKAFALGILVEVAGKKMQKDFEPILERQIHRFFNYAMGLMHIGQRDMNLLRISKEAYLKGFRLKHLGIILYSMFHREYSGVVDKVSVHLYTEEEKVIALKKEAQLAYLRRDERLGDLSDEAVDEFYSCLVCQSFAPGHVCVLTPEHLGLCGAYSWLDAKVAYQILPSGPNQPIRKYGLLDSRLGQWEGVNRFVREKSNKNIERVSMYSLLDHPHSSCSFFECIAAILPEVNGVMVVSRDYAGMTPCGMTFSTLATLMGEGRQTPGFLGMGRLYLVSKKFLAAEGGLLRLVWMPRQLKEMLADKLKKRLLQIGEPKLLDKIADENIAQDIEGLKKFLLRVRHPVLELPPII